MATGCGAAIELAGEPFSLRGDRAGAGARLGTFGGEATTAGDGDAAFAGAVSAVCDSGITGAGADGGVLSFADGGILGGAGVSATAGGGETLACSTGALFRGLPITIAANGCGSLIFALRDRLPLFPISLLWPRRR